MLSDHLLGTLSKAWRALATLDRPIALMGGLALSAWNQIRATRDVDLLVAIDETDVARLQRVLTENGFRPRREDGPIKLGDVDLMQFLFEPPGTLIDVRVDVLMPRGPYHRQLLTRRVPTTLPGVDEQVYVVACEDLILLKLLAGRVIDLVDAAGLLRSNEGAIDTAYLVDWATELKLRAELEQVWDEAFPSEKPPDPQTK